ncbi:MAG: class I mannose-6-phosphate isomerase [Anaerococcus sp.]|nr:class I mannose-6-phosphate isomerase [Anaerococcus sp.]
MKDILFLKGKFQEKIWGGSRLKDEFAYPIPNEKIGEYWAISDMDKMSSTIINGDYKGLSLREVYRKDKELFGNPTGKSFPLLVKIIDASDDLSIQVHPDDKMASKLEGSRGKTECWYILNDKPSSIIYGLKVDDKKEAVDLIDQKRWDDLLRDVPTKKGDFFFVRAGTVHAIKKGSLILEIQQASDITYRLYDYDRKGKDGKLRDLHIEKSKEAIKILDNKEEIRTLTDGDLNLRILTDNEYFKVLEKKLTGTYNFTKENPYSLFACIDGEGQIGLGQNSYKIGKGDFFILTNLCKNYTIEGSLTLVEAIGKNS